MKSKLVSKNPILRFKLGKLILFALNGLGRWFYNGKEVFSDDGGKTFKLNESGSLTGAPGAIRNLVRADKVGKGAYKVGNSWYKIGGNGRPATVTETPLKSVKLKNGRVVNKMSDGYWYWADTGEKVEKFASPNSLNVSRNGKPTTTPDGKTVGIDDVVTQAMVNAIPSGLPKKTNIFLKGFERRQNEINNLGGISAVQNLLKKQGYNIGKYGADGKWGSDTEAAYQEYLNNQNLKNLGQQPLALSAYSNINITQPLMLNFSNIRNANFNRSQTRDLMRTAGYNPYSFSGELRKALRLYLNGESNDTSELSGIDLNRFNTNPYLYKETPYGQDWKSNLLNTLSLSYRKKGGTLSSRNPITRFKVSNSVTALKTGGNIAFFKKGGYKPYKWEETLPNPILLKNLKETYNKIEAADKRASQFRKASTRANRDTKVPLLSNNLATLQDLLWKIGAFKGVKDRRGKESTYETAVDGMDGKMTKEAIANAEKMGYALNDNGTLLNPKKAQPKEQPKTETTTISPRIITTGGAYIPAQVIERATQSVGYNPKVLNAADFLGHNPGLILLEDMGRSNINRVINRTLGVRPVPGRTIESLPSLLTEELKKLVQFARSKGKTGFDADMYKLMYGHEYGSSKGEGGQDRSGLWNRINTPKGRLEHTLGSYGFYVDENGNTIVHDIYDFNVNLHLGGNTRYSALRNFAGEFASKSTDPNEGKIKYRINLGKLD